MSTLNFAKHHLSPKGQLLLIYSDLAFNLGLQEPNRVLELCSQTGLRCQLADSTSLPLGKNPFDPLKLIKKKSNVQLWRITKE